MVLTRSAAKRARAAAEVDGGTDPRRGSDVARHILPAKPLFDESDVSCRLSVRMTLVMRLFKIVYCILLGGLKSEVATEVYRRSEPELAEGIDSLIKFVLNFAVGLNELLMPEPDERVTAHEVYEETNNFIRANYEEAMDVMERLNYIGTPSSIKARRALAEVLSS